MTRKKSDDQPPSPPSTRRRIHLLSTAGEINVISRDPAESRPVERNGAV